MPSAACSQRSAWAVAMALSSAAMMRSLGSGSMITPVENGSTWLASICKRWASAAQVARARARPSVPVPALALPVLMTMARISAPCARFCWQICTGAAQKRLVVKTPPTLLPASSKNTDTSLRPCLRTPASTTPMRTPAIGNRVEGSGAGRLTGMVRSQASFPWHCLYFLPLPQGQGSLRPTRANRLASIPGAAGAASVVWASPVSVGAV